MNLLLIFTIFSSFVDYTYEEDKGLLKSLKLFLSLLAIPPIIYEIVQYSYCPDALISAFCRKTMNTIFPGIIRLADHHRKNYESKSLPYGIKEGLFTRLLTICDDEENDIIKKDREMLCISDCKFESWYEEKNINVMNRSVVKRETYDISKIKNMYHLVRWEINGEIIDLFNNSNFVYLTIDDKVLAGARIENNFYFFSPRFIGEEVLKVFNSDEDVHVRLVANNDNYYSMLYKNSKISFTKYIHKLVTSQSNLYHKLNRYELICFLSNENLEIDPKTISNSLFSGKFKKLDTYHSGGENKKLYVSLIRDYCFLLSRYNKLMNLTIRDDLKNVIDPSTLINRIIEYFQIPNTQFYSTYKYIGVKGNTYKRLSRVREYFFPNSNFKVKSVNKRMKMGNDASNIIQSIISNKSIFPRKLDEENREIKILSIINTVKKNGTYHLKSFDNLNTHSEQEINSRIIGREYTKNDNENITSKKIINSINKEKSSFIDKCVFEIENKNIIKNCEFNYDRVVKEMKSIINLYNNDYDKKADKRKKYLINELNENYFKKHDESCCNDYLFFKKIINDFEESGVLNEISLFTECNASDIRLEKEKRDQCNFIDLSVIKNEIKKVINSDLNALSNPGEINKKRIIEESNKIKKSLEFKENKISKELVKLKKGKKKKKLELKRSKLKNNLLAINNFINSEHDLKTNNLPNHKYFNNYARSLDCLNPGENDNIYYIKKHEENLDKRKRIVIYKLKKYNITDDLKNIREIVESINDCKINSNPQNRELVSNLLKYILSNLNHYRKDVLKWNEYYENKVIIYQTLKEKLSLVNSLDDTKSVYTDKKTNPEETQIIKKPMSYCFMTEAEINNKKIEEKKLKKKEEREKTQEIIQSVRNGTYRGEFSDHLRDYYPVTD